MVSVLTPNLRKVPLLHRCKRTAARASLKVGHRFRRAISEEPPIPESLLSTNKDRLSVLGIGVDITETKLSSIDKH